MNPLRFTCIALIPSVLLAQRGTGELRISSFDAAGLPIDAAIELASQSNQQRRQSRAIGGQAVFPGLPFGMYHLAVSREQFQTSTRLVEIRSEAPLDLAIRLEVAGSVTALVISESETLLDPRRTGMPGHVGRERIEQRRTALPSRGVIELVESQPGWLLEANGVLHPRGSEYNTQYVVDGIPLLDNRSPGFAPPLEVEGVGALNILTANYPAEYGRKLGGVVEATTARVDTPGLRVRTSASGGSFGTLNGHASAHYLRGGTAASLSGHGARTRRFLDAPVEENFANTGRTRGASARLDHDLDSNNRIRLSGHSQRSSFLAPNDSLQQAAGQRQDRAARETMAQAAYQRIMSPRLLLHARGMVRDFEARLWSNSLSTPLITDQDRGFREAYLGSSVSYSRFRHEWKWGGEWIGAGVREDFGYKITNPARFEDAPSVFRFRDRARSNECAAFVQDLARFGNWTVSAGLRFDAYRFLVRSSAWSPRIGIARHFPTAGLVLRASYDRAFETPPVENLLLASSQAARSLTEEAFELPVQPSKGHFFQAGFSKTLGAARLGGTWFQRRIRNFGDDDVLLNTGIAFPITFSRAQIHGIEAKLELPKMGALSGWVSYANLNGTGYLPVTGGLFLDDDVLEARGRFPITQDQRHTGQARVLYALHPRVWVAGGARYGSGLPFELEDEFDPSGVSARVLERLDVERGRARPTFILDLGGGATLWKSENHIVKLQVDVTNVTGRLQVINFAGVFSGTALAAPRAAMLRLNTEF